MNYSEIILQVATLYIVMFIGALVNRLKIITDETIAGISKLILFVTIPGTILTGLANSDTLKRSEISEMFIISIISYVFLFAMSIIILRILFVKKEERPFYQYICLFGNIGFIGYPMVMTIIGESSILLAAIPNVFYSMLLYSVGIYLMSRYSKEDKEPKLVYKKLINPGIIAAIVGLCLFIFNIRLPLIVEKMASMLGGLTSPLAMIVVGASINKINLKKIMKNYRIILISILKMIGYPLAYAYLLKFIGLTGLPAMVSVVLLGMPVATTAVITATEYNKENLVKASEASVFSTLLLIFTVPILSFAVAIVA